MPRVRASWGRTAGFLLVLVVVLSALIAFLPAVPANSNPNPLQGSTSGRDPYLWPFASNSIWNLPIGANAFYIPAKIKQATGAGMTTDPDVIILTPTAPSTAVYQNNDGWSGGSRCSPQGGVLFSGPIPSDFVIPGATSSSTPNDATAILMPDNRTLAQGQPMARCTAGGPATMMWYNENEKIDGLGFSGGHGGSMLSSIGGTIRLGELVPGGVIRHVLKVNLYGHDDYFYNASTKGYRWPATTADSYAGSVYGGTVAALRMGSLLALPANLNISSMGLETEPARMLALAFQNYGAYVVDDAGWSVYAIETEFSPKGQVEDEFQNDWGFSMTPSSTNTAWARDMNRIFGSLSVVDNWDAAKWTAVSASNGSQGAGGGAPRVPWAPPLGSSPPPPPTSQVTVQSPAAGTQMTPGGKVTLSWTSSGSLEANSASLSFSSDGGTTWNTPFATGQPLNGSFLWQAPNVTTNQAMLRVVVQDTSGKSVEGRSGEFTIQPASPPPTGFPVARLSYGPRWPQPTTSVGFDASTSSPAVQNGILEARWDWQNDGTWDTGWSTTLTALHAYGVQGNFTAHLEVRDPSGAADNATVNLVVDGTPPATTATASGSSGTGGWYASNVGVSLSAADGLSGVASTFIRLDGGSWYAYSAPISVGNGRHDVDFYSVDRAGVTEAVQALHVRVDTSHPTFKSKSPRGVVSSSQVQLSWEATDPTSSTIRYATSVDGGPFTDRGTNTSLSLVLPDGAHWVVVRATDDGGNSADAIISFRIDTNPFSFTGPFGGAPMIGVIVVAALLTFLGGTLARRSRQRRVRNLGPSAARQRARSRRRH